MLQDEDPDRDPRHSPFPIRCAVANRCSASPGKTANTAPFNSPTHPKTVRIVGVPPQMLWKATMNDPNATPRNAVVRLPAAPFDSR